ncbi:hypothetical protein [Caballeronia catudaia]|nr:hypothetical protein [Caballeronia catudaia]
MRREIDVLTSLFPRKPPNEIRQFVAEWRLVDWKNSEEATQTVLSRLDDESRGETRVEKPVAPAEGAASTIFKAVDSASPLWFDELERRELTRFVTPAPIERFMPSSLVFAEKKAEVLSALIMSTSSSLAYHIVARIFGFLDWPSMTKSLTSSELSLTDEELPHDELFRRVAWQVDALMELFQVDRPSAFALHALWRPTSRSTRYSVKHRWLGEPLSGRRELSVEPRARTRLSPRRHD